MAGDRDWGVDPINETLPAFAGPDDPAIVLGTDLPPCMQSVFASAIFFRSKNTASGGINGGPSYFIGQSKNDHQIFEGWLVYDQSTVCGYVLTHTINAQNLGAGVIFGAGERFGATFETGAATYGGNTIEYFFGSDFGFPKTLVTFGPNPTLQEFSIDNVSAARGLRARADSVANTGAIAAEGVTLSTPTFKAYQGRAYALVTEYTAQSSAVSQSQWNIRLTNLAGAIVVQGADVNPVAGAAPAPTFTHIQRVRKTSADSNINFVQTAAASAGNVTHIAGAAQPRFFEVWDCGSAADFGNAPAI